MYKIDFKLIIDIVQTVTFIMLLVYLYTLLGFTLYQSVLAVSNVIFGMIALSYFLLNKKN